MNKNNNHNKSSKTYVSKYNEKHVLVISESEKDVVEIMELYNKNRHIQFCSKRNEAAELYEGTINKYDLNGEFLNPFDFKLYIPISEEEFNGTDLGLQKKILQNGKIIYMRYAPELVGATLRNVSFKELYPSLDDFMKIYLKIPYNQEENDFGEWINPNGKWEKYNFATLLRNSENNKLEDIVQKKNCKYLQFITDAYVSRETGWHEPNPTESKFETSWIFPYQKMLENLKEDTYLSIINYRENL